ncbi:MAG: hypothetical protein JJT95_12620 [Pararhodobacter sp.]|nr:hypothetical protein [Pararhodobacter sp.]
MKGCMVIVAPLAVMALSALPLAAFSLSDLEGRWRGEGVLALAGEPPQRFRCQIRFRDSANERSVFSGRCATAQGAQSFIYMLHPLPEGQIRAENRAEPPHELPDEMQGIIGGGVLRFEADNEALFELRLEGELMRFRVESERGETRGSGEVSLRRVEG